MVERADRELTACPYVYGFTIRLLPQHLWRQVARGSGEAYTHTHTWAHTQTRMRGHNTNNTKQASGSNFSAFHTSLHKKARSCESRRSCNQQHKNGISQTAECVRGVIYREHDRGKGEIEEEGGSSECGRFSLVNGQLTCQFSLCIQEKTWRHDAPQFI